MFLTYMAILAGTAALIALALYLITVVCTPK